MDLFDLEELPVARVSGKEIKKKALCIALNYAKSDSPCFGNIQACTSLMQSLLVYGHYFDQRTITDINAPITKKTVTEALDWLLEDAEDGDIMILVLAGRGNFELSDGTEYAEFNQIPELAPLGTTVLILSDVYLPLECRFLCKDISTPCAASKQIGSKKFPTLSSKPETRRYEEMSKHETCSTIICMYSGEGSRGHLAFTLDTLLSTTYSYSVSLQSFLQYCQASMVVNSLDVECNLEIGQYLDLRVPLGRLLHLPI